MLVALLFLLARPPAVDGAAASSGGALLRAALAAPDKACRGFRLDGQGLARFYSAASPMLLWVNEGGPGPRARQLRAALERADDEGLPPARYGLAGIEAYWHASAPAELACLDLMLTAAFERYARDLAVGRVAPREADRTWHLPTAAFDPVTTLQAILPGADIGEQLGRLAPAHGLYRRLRPALAHYRHLAEHGGWDTSLTGPRLKAGDEGERIAALRERLRPEGDLEPAASSSGRYFDTVLTDAVQRFQRRHGLLDDGIVGPRTLAALNTSAAERVAQLRRAMERLRWMPRDLGPHYVLVNTAAFELAVVEGDRSVLGMRVIVGTLDQPTPSFTATLRSLVINPYWNVPLRIARDKLLPRERQSQGYLAAHGFRIFDARTGGWREPDATALARAQRGDSGSSLRLRQEPGPGNLMGRLSFVFPNPYDVFLHDTPDRSLFEREVRACSEGCVRIEQAMALALHVLRRTPEWTEKRLQQEIDALRHQVLTLPEPIPVYVVYLPTWVNDEGVVHFRPDHYRRESVLARSRLLGEGDQVATAAAHRHGVAHDRLSADGRRSVPVRTGRVSRGTADASPQAHAPHVEMDEVGFRVVADAAASQGDGGCTDPRQGPARDAEVNGHAPGMKAVRGHACRRGLEERVARGRAVSRDDLERLGGVEARAKGAQEPEQPSIDLVDLARAVIPQHPVDVSQRVGDEAAVLPVHTVE